MLRVFIIINLTYDTINFCKFITLKITADEFWTPLKRTSNLNNMNRLLFNDIAMLLLNVLDVTLYIQVFKLIKNNLIKTL